MDIDKFMEETREAILDHGFTVQYADQRSVSFNHLPRAHTVGRTLFGKPEILIIGPFTSEQMGEFISELVAAESDDDTYCDGHETDPIAGRAWRFQDAEPSALIGAMAAFGPIQALQAVWADPDTGKFPGEPQMLRPPGFSPIHPSTDPYGPADPFKDTE